MFPFKILNDTLVEKQYWSKAGKSATKLLKIWNFEKVCSYAYGLFKMGHGHLIFIKDARWFLWVIFDYIVAIFWDMVERLHLKEFSQIHCTLYHKNEILNALFQIGNFYIGVNIFHVTIDTYLNIRV